MNEDEARTYLTSLSGHKTRPGDVSNMYGDFAVRLATALKQANDQGMNLSLESGFRTPGQTGSHYDAIGDSSHTYGIASDIHGLGQAGSPAAQQWASIAGQNGLYNPYTINNAKEFNHWQYTQKPLEKMGGSLLGDLKNAYATGNQQNVFNVLAKANLGGGTMTPSGGGGPDSRQLVFNMLTKDLGLTPQQAVGALWSLAGESGPGLNPKASNPKDPGTAYGMGQWILDRKTNLMNFAQANNLNPADAATQVAFMKHELQGDHSGALTAIRGASTSADAAHAWTTTYEVPKNAEARAAERIAAGGKVASLDANGNLVLPNVPASATATPSGGGAPATTTPAGPVQPTFTPMTPQQVMGMSLGQSLANIGSSGGGHAVDPPDAPPIRTPAMETPAPMTQAGNLGSQLGIMAARGPLPDPEASITSGAPSMTSMLDTLGTPSTYNMYDPRATQTPSLTMRNPRLA